MLVNVIFNIALATEKLSGKILGEWWRFEDLFSSRTNHHGAQLSANPEDL